MKLYCDIQLPASKSESNRALMIAAYGGFAPDFQDLSDSNDTLVLAEALSSLPFMSFQRGIVRRRESIKVSSSIINIADCGTAARFLTTFLACHSGRWLLTGTERMKQRPFRPLVEALRNLGASIQYAEKEGFLPLQIEGKAISGGQVRIDMSQSSQFASSLLLAAPMWAQGLEIELLGILSSLPYLNMTMSIMRHFGAEVEQKGQTIIVKPKPYQPRRFKVSSDWSAASYWYEMAALSEDCEIKLRSLSLSKGRPNLQGDAVVAEWMKSLGVNTIETEDSLILRKIPFEKRPLSFDFSAHPDLFPTMAATCAGLRLEARFSGVANLVLKESNRVEAMQSELDKIGAKFKYQSENELVLIPSSRLPFFEKPYPLRFESHGDHRIVMALAPLAEKVGSLIFDHPEVVEKSYPNFWTEASFLLF